MSEIKVLSASGETAFLGLWMTTFSLCLHMASSMHAWGWKERSLESLLLLIRSYQVKAPSLGSHLSFVTFL